MNTGRININGNTVTVNPVHGTVWLTKYQIADLFGTFVPTVGNHIRSVLKAGLLKQENVALHQQTATGKTIELYNLEMIVTLAFRIRSEKAEVFRAWVIRRAVHGPVPWNLMQTGLILN